MPVIDNDANNAEISSTADGQLRLSANGAERVIVDTAGRVGIGTLTPDAALIPIFDAAGAPLVVCGPTHMQFDRTIGATRVVNAGSVGMPFGEPGAYWLLLAEDVELRRTA